jgi:hypothetical protein
MNAPWPIEQLTENGPWTLEKMREKSGYSIVYLAMLASRSRIQGAIQDPKTKRWTINPPGAIINRNGTVLWSMPKPSAQLDNEGDSPSPAQRKPYA